MATRDQLIDITLTASLQQGTDSPSIDPPGLITLKDGLLNKDGGIRKRLGAIQEETQVLARNHEARWLADYNGDILTGTTGGIFSYPAALGPRTNSPCAVYDSVVDHQKLSGIPNNVVEIDSCSDGTYTFVAFTQATTYPAFQVFGDLIFYAVYDTASGDLLISPRQIHIGTYISRPRVIYNGIAVSFWWIEGNDTSTQAVQYTDGVAAGNLVNQGIFTTFTVVSPCPGTDITWAQRDNFDAVLVSVVDGFDLTTFTSLGPLTTFTPGPISVFQSETLYITSIKIDANNIAVVGYEGYPSTVGSLGLFDARLYDVAFNAFGGAQSGVLYASPNGPSVIAASNYFYPATRMVLSLAVELSGIVRVCIWGSTFYEYIAGGGVGAAYGAVTTFASLDASFALPVDYHDPIRTYAVATHAFNVAGRQSQAIGLIRAGINLGGTTTEVAENLATCIFVAPSEPPEFPEFEALPLTQAFELRIPNTFQPINDGIPSSPQSIPFSIGQVFVDQDSAVGLVSVFFRTKLTPTAYRSYLNNAGNVDTLADYAFEVARIQTRPYPQRRYVANGDSVGRGIANYFDGAYSCEIVPHDIPLLATYIAPNTSYITTVVYSWEDAQSNTHRSAPSLSGKLYKDTSTNEFFFYVWDFPLTGAAFDTQLLQLRNVELYINNADGVPTAIGATPYTRGTFVADAPHLRRYDVAWFGSTATTSLDNPSGQAIYTAGDVLENQAPPAFKDTCVAKGRMFGLTDTQLFYSKPLEPRVAPEFNYALTVQVPDNTGRTTAIMGMDDKVVVLCERGIYILYGDGPNALGTGGSFAQLLRIPGNIGCSYPGSAAECPHGIAFLSQQGFYLVDRSLNISFIGNPVVDVTDAVINGESVPYGIASTVHDIRGRHVRFIVDAASDLDDIIWYYDTGQWGSFSKANELQCVYSDNTVKALIGTGQNAIILAETDATGMYNGLLFLMHIRTGWIRFQNIEGFQRAKELVFALRPGKDPALPLWQGMDVNLYSDYIDDIDSTSTWASVSMTNDIYATSPNQQRKDFRVHFKTQKTPAVSVEFVELPYTVLDIHGQPIATAGIDAILSGLSVRVGVRAGTNKQSLSATRMK